MLFLTDVAGNNGLLIEQQLCLRQSQPLAQVKQWYADTRCIVATEALSLEQCLAQSRHSVHTHVNLTSPSADPHYGH